MVGGRDKPYTLEDSESGKFVPIGCFDCRGIEAIDFSFRDGWAAQGVKPSTHFAPGSTICLIFNQRRKRRIVVLGFYCQYVLPRFYSEWTW